MAPINELKYTTLTRTVNEMKSPNTFLKNLLFGNHQTVPTEDIEVHMLHKGREIAPFVRKNGEGVMVDGYSATGRMVAAPNIRIKRPFQASELLFGRRPGTVIYNNGASGQMSAAQQHIARDMQVMADLITNAEEYLCSQMLQGAITYEQEDQEVFKITVPRPAACNITLSTFWNDATPTNVALWEDLHAIKRVSTNETGLSITDAICGTEAADALIRLHQAGIPGFNKDFGAVGEVAPESQFNEEGVIYLGRIAGIRFWEYGRSADLNGSSVDMIRPKYVEFVTRSRAAERVLYYGAIPDMKTFQGRRFQTERFAKSWQVEDPSAMMALAHSRPLPVPRRPAAQISAKVVSG